MLPIDSTVFLWLNASATSPHALVALALFATEQLPALMIAGTVGAFIAGDREVRHGVLRVLVAIAAAWALARLGQHGLHTSRPFMIGLGTQWLSHGSSSGFPSTHASVAFAFGFGVAGIARHRALAVAALLLAALVAWSRVCLGLHFPSDVLAGAVVGAIAAWIGSSLPRRSPAARPVY